MGRESGLMENCLIIINKDRGNDNEYTVAQHIQAILLEQGIISDVTEICFSNYIWRLWLGPLRIC